MFACCFVFAGPEKFQEGLALYMARHAYGNTETVDLWNAWSEVSGLDVAQLMSTWTTVMGYPYVTVVAETWSDSEVQITLEQHRFLSDGSADPESADTLWSIPLLFATPGSTSSQALIMNQRTQTFAVPLPAAGSSGRKPWLKINAGQQALVRVAHSPEMIARLQDSIEEVDGVDRAALLLDAYALAKAGLAPLESVVDVLRALQNETSSIVWGAIAGVLGGLHMLMEQLQQQNPSSAPAFQSLLAFGKRTVLKGLSQVIFVM
jgi:aminopeptidase N